MLSIEVISFIIKSYATHQCIREKIGMLLQIKVFYLINTYERAELAVSSEATYHLFKL